MGVEPTKTAVTVQGIEINRIADGKIAESWAISDALGMLRQLGSSCRSDQPRSASTSSSRDIFERPGTSSS
jgi:hypothetical protein